MPMIAPPPIRHFRAVNEQLLAGAQPSPSDYRILAAMGITTVIDLRSGSPIDPRPDDAEFLRHLGIEYIALPLTDGHAPSGELLDRFFASVDRAPGPVYVHCAAGVGRTTSIEMAYRSRLGMEHGVRQQLAVGPPTIEQIWFVASLGNGEPATVPSVVQMTSRALDSPRHVIGWLRAIAAKMSSRKRLPAR